MKKTRIATIDILRALTMFLMIWVNDFWTLTDIPKWLQHAKSTEDYLGFSDIIFPLFLFIMGLSIPFAIEQRKKTGATSLSISKHIIIRTISLLIIGVFMVNYETAHHETLLIGKYYWCFIMALGVSLIWMHWKKSHISKKKYHLLQLSGLLILIFLAMIYKGGTDGELWMRTQWWGILGLIGWSYVANSLLFIYSKGNLYSMLVFLVIFNLLTLLYAANLLPQLEGVYTNFTPIYHGAIPAFTTAGIVLSLLLKKQINSPSKNFIFHIATIGGIFISYGIWVRSYWGISKIKETPSWLAICTGIGFLLFALFYFITDIKKKTTWAKLLAPAGTATLTCYMIPYFIYPLRNITGIRFPEFLNSGILGLFISLIYAFLVVLFTGWMEKKGYKLKL